VARANREREAHGGRFVPQGNPWGMDLRFECCTTCPTESALETVDLSDNRLGERAPSWLAGTLKGTTRTINLTGNLFTGDYTELARLGTDSGAYIRMDPDTIVTVSVKPQQVQGQCAADTEFFKAADPNSAYSLGTCVAMPDTCPRGYELDGVKKRNGQDPCVPCAGMQQLYSLGTTCRKCPDGFDCTRGYFRIRAKEGGFWMGQPLFMACVSNSTLRAVGLDTAAAKADAARHLSERVALGESADWWKCGENSTMVSSPARVLNDSLVRFEGRALVYPCPNPEACVMRDDGIADCANGYWGPLCGLCQEGHVWSEGHICTPCTGDMLSWRVGVAVGAVVAALIAFYIFLASPLFENEDEGGPGKRIFAWASQCWARRQPAAPPPDSELIIRPSVTGTGGLTVEPTAASLRARILATVWVIYTALAQYWQRIAGIMEYRDEKQGAQTRCLIGFSQVGRFPSPQIASARGCVHTQLSSARCF
jgi:hypothetical protein